MGRSCIVLVILALFAYGCMGAPRNNQYLTTIQDNVFLGGAYPEPAVDITVAYVDHSGNLAGTIATLKSGATPSPAAGGWYPWAGSAQLNDYSKWNQYPGTTALYTAIKAHATKDGRSLDLASFDNLGTKEYVQCKADHQSGGIQSVIDNCKSDASPNVILWAGCGASGQTCCKDAPACVGGVTCDGTTHICGGTATPTTIQLSSLELRNLIFYPANTSLVNPYGAFDTGKQETMSLPIKNVENPSILLDNFIIQGTTTFSQ